MNFSINGIAISPNSVDVGVVGAGPVGLWTSILTKILSPELNIVHLDKHRVYKRSHLLQLNPSAFKGIPDHPELVALKKYVVAQKYRIRTNDLETRLQQIATKLGISIEEQKVEAPTDLKTQFPNAKVFIGGDGSHSKVRKVVCDDQFRFNKDLQYIAEVKYETTGDTTQFSKLTHAYRTNKLMGCVGVERVGTNTDGITPVTLRLFIDEKTFKNMSGATFEHPYSLNSPTIDPELKNKIQLWLNAKEKIKDEKRVEGSEKITVTHLTNYASKLFTKVDEDGTVWLLVGDSAFGVPFFSSLKTGFLSGTNLAYTLKDYFASRDVKVLSSYEKYVGRLALWESIYAYVKSLFITLYIYFVQISGVVPWQVNKWSAAQAEQFWPQEA